MSVENEKLTALSIIYLAFLKALELKSKKSSIHGIFHILNVAQDPVSEIQI